MAVTTYKTGGNMIKIGRSGSYDKFDHFKIFNLGTITLYWSEILKLTVTRDWGENIGYIDSVFYLYRLVRIGWNRPGNDDIPF